MQPKPGVVSAATASRSLAGERTDAGLRAAALFLAAAWLALDAPAQTSWKGTTSTSWSTAANWTAGVPTSSTDAIIGDANFTGSYQPSVNSSASCKSLTVGAGTKSSTLSVRRKLTVTGSLTIGTNGLITHNVESSSYAITLSGNWTNLGSYVASRSSSTLTFAGVNQVLAGPTTCSRLTVNAGSTTTLAANVAVTNLLTVNGRLDPQTTTVSGTGKLTLGSAGTLLVRAATFAGNYALTGKKTLSGGSTVNYAATGNQTVEGSLAYHTLRISGSGVKSLATNLPSLSSTNSTEGNLYVDGGTFTLGQYTAARGGSVSGGTFSVAAGATLRIGGTNTFPAGYATHSLSAGSTVEYYGTNQTVSAESYGHLTLSSSGTATKTLPGTALTVAGDFTALTNTTGAAVTFTAGAAMTVNGAVCLGPGVTFNGGAASHAFGGNWTNHGTFLHTNGTVTFNDADVWLAGTGASQFHDLTFAGAGIRAEAGASFSVSGNLATAGVGSFTHLPDGTGELTLTGSGKTISGAGLNFSRLRVTGSLTTTATFNVAGHLGVDGSLTATAGTISLTGTNQLLYGSGTITLFALSVPGVATTTNNFSLGADLAVNGSFTATAGTATFAGSTVFSGTANLHHTTLNGTLLRLAAGSTLRLAGNTTLLAGVFDSTNHIPNTVVYNGAAAQTVFPITYCNLEIAGNGVKSAAGNLTTRGDFTIAAGAEFDAGNGGYTNSVYGDWRNEGTFTPGDSVVELLGDYDAGLYGHSTFHCLRLNKSGADEVVRLGADQTAGTLDLAAGLLDTDTNTLTLTGTRTGNGVVLGTLARRHAFSTGTAYAFSSPQHTVTFVTASDVTNITITTSADPVADFPFGACINRQFIIAVSGGAYDATLRLPYEDAGLNGNDETSLQLWQRAAVWTAAGKSANDAAANWVEQTGLTNLAGRWTLSDNASVARWNGSVSAAWETADNWTVVQGSPERPPSVNDIVELGPDTFIHDPVITSAAVAKSISFGSAQAVTLTLGTGGSLTIAGNLGGAWTNDRTHTLAVGGQRLDVGGDLRLSDGTNGHRINLDIGAGVVTVADDLVQAGDASLTFTGAGQLSVGGDFHYAGGTFSPGESTFTYRGSAPQAVGGVTYNHLVFDQSAGTATLSAPASVNGDLTLTNAGALHLHADLIVAGNVWVQTNASLDGSGAEIAIGGNWTCDGAFIATGGEVALIGTSAQSVGPCHFHDFDIEKPSGTATLAGNISVDLDVDVDSGTLDLGDHVIEHAAAGALLYLGPGATLRVATVFPTNFAIVTIDPDSTVEYYGSGAQLIAPVTYGHLQLHHGGANAKTLGGATVVAGDFTIGSDATVAAGGYLLKLSGNWTNEGGFLPGSGAVELAGAGRHFRGETTLNDLTVSGSYALAGDDLTITGNLDVEGALDVGGGHTTLDGDLINRGTLTSSGVTTFTGTRPQTFQLLGAVASSSSGVINFNGSVAPVLVSSGSPAFMNVNLNNTAGLTPSVGWIVAGAFNVASNSAFHAGPHDHTFYGAFTNLGTVTSSGLLNFHPLTAQTLLLSGGSFASSGSVRFGGAAALSLMDAGATWNSVIIANTHAAGLTPASDWTLTEDLVIQGGAEFHAGAGRTHVIGRDVICDGELDGQSSLLVLTGAANIGGSGETVFHHLRVTGSVTVVGDCDVSGSFTNEGAFDATGFALDFEGEADGWIAGSAMPVLDTLAIEKSSPSASVRLALDLSNIVTLNVTGGTLDTGGFRVNADAPGDTLNVGADARLKLGGTTGFPQFTAVTLDPASTVEYAGSGAQTVAAQTYGHLATSGGGAKTLDGDATAAGDVTIAGGTFADGGHVLAVSGSLTNLATHAGGGRIRLSGGTTNHVLAGGGQFQNLELNDSQNAILTGTNLHLAGTLTLGTGTINTDTNRVVLTAGATVLRTNGYVLGWLQKHVSVATVTNYAFEVGDATGYAPVAVTFTNVTTDADFVAGVFAGDHPDVGASGVAGVRSVNRYWSLTNYGAAFASAGATFSYSAGDLDAGADASQFVVARKLADVWSPVTVATVSTSNATVLALSAFGDFVIGESSAPPALGAQPVSQRISSGGNVTFTVSATGPAPLGYQWRFNGGNLAGATDPALTQTAVNDSHAGSYSVVVTNLNGEATSSNAVLTINHAPVAGTHAAGGYKNSPVLLSAAKLAASGSDPDGDPLNVVGVSHPSAQGGTVALNSGTITYTPPADFTGADSFAYTVSDPLGATANGTVNLTIRAPGSQPQRVVSVQARPDQNVCVTFAGIPGRAYLVQAATNLVSPVWLTIATNTAGASGLFSFDDLDATNHPTRYYRSATP